MALNGYTKSCGKKSGGVIEISLVETSNIKNITFDISSDSFSFIELCDGAKFASYQFKEDQAYLHEKVTMIYGSPSIEHTISFVLDRTGENSIEAVTELIRSSPQGIVALATTRSGEVLLLGYSLKLGMEQPLRIVSIEAQTEKNPAQNPTESIVLKSTDTQKAKIFNGEIITAP